MRYIITESQYKLIMEDGPKIEPSHTAVKNICDSKKFCSAQGRITFGQLRALVNTAKKERLWKGVGEGGFKAMIRLLPWFLPQVAIAGVIGSSVRALNKIFRPTITETDTYKKWWGKAIMRSFDLAEGDLPIEDPLTKIFFISDGLMTMIDDKYELKFANYISNIASSMPDDAEVPDFLLRMN